MICKLLREIVLLLSWSGLHFRPKACSFSSTNLSSSGAKTVHTRQEIADWRISTCLQFGHVVNRVLSCAILIMNHAATQGSVGIGVVFSEKVSSTSAARNSPGHPAPLNAKRRRTQVVVPMPSLLHEPTFLMPLGSRHEASPRGSCTLHDGYIGQPERSKNLCATITSSFSHSIMLLDRRHSSLGVGRCVIAGSWSYLVPEQLP